MNEVSNCLDQLSADLREELPASRAKRNVPLYGTLIHYLLYIKNTSLSSIRINSCKMLVV